MAAVPFATPEKMHGIVDRVLREKKPDDRIVIVVSAMGDSTDDLLDLAAKVTDNMPKRELDMLLSTGEQVSIALPGSCLLQQGTDLQFLLLAVRLVFTPVIFIAKQLFWMLMQSGL